MAEVEEGSSDLADDSFSSDGEDEELKKAQNESDAEDEPNKGWADAMAKILNKPISSEKSGTILVKSKALEKEKERDRLEKLEKKKQSDKKRQWEMMSRVKPDAARDKALEKNLQKIATRGVVQLFNAVRTHQSKVQHQLKEAGSSERKKSKLMSSVTKRDFIDVLRGKATKSERADRRAATKDCVPIWNSLYLGQEPALCLSYLLLFIKNSVKSETTSEWNILRDDFMMGATMKDWDKDSEDEARDGGAEDYSGSDSER